MTEALRGQPVHVQCRTALFVVLLVTVNVVMDGLPKVISPLIVQLFLLPLTGIFLLSAAYFLLLERLSLSDILQTALRQIAIPARQGWLIVVLQALFIFLFLYQTRHFADFGYHLALMATGITFSVGAASIVFLAVYPDKVSSLIRVTVYLAAYVAGQTLSILNFPLSYLRSDMLPVILWSDQALLEGGNPYQHFYVAERIYDFPYLPGTLLAFLPAQALHLDLRWASMLYLVAGMILIYQESATSFRASASLLIGLFLLCPYLQYRHELYTQPYFFSLILIFVLYHRRLFGWSSAAFGLSVVISQFSWVIFPFFLLNALRRNGWREVARTAMISGATALVFLTPFLHAGVGSIAHNAVGQWDRLERPIARPINLAFWASYVVHPSNLKWLQLLLLTAIFFFCWSRDRCSDLYDMLRWMIVALLTFILFNVLVDGYFYLMLLVPMLIYTCVANGWWIAEGKLAE